LCFGRCHVGLLPTTRGMLPIFTTKLRNMGLLTRLFEVTGRSYPSFFSNRHGGSTCSSLGKLGKEKMAKLQKSVTKVFFGCFVTAKKMIFRLILREKNLFFFRVFPKRCQSIRHDDAKKMRGMSDLLSRKTLLGDPLLSFVSSVCLFWQFWRYYPISQF